MFNLIQDGGAKKVPHTSFSSVTSANVRISPQNFLSFVFNLFATLVQNFKFVPRILDSLAGCRTKFLFAVFCNIGALESNAYWFHV